MTSPTNQPDISKAEFEVLDALWEIHPASSSEIIDQLNLSKQWHDKTVKTLLGRLVKKQVINFTKQARSYSYFPLVERQAYNQKASKTLVSRLFGGKVAPLVAGFANEGALSKEDINELKSLIEKWEQDNG